MVEIIARSSSVSLSVFRSVRLLRIFKLVRPVRVQVLVILRTMSSVVTFLGLLFLFIFAFAILGMNLFGDRLKFKDDQDKLVPVRSNFDTFLWAMITVFQVSVCVIVVVVIAEAHCNSRKHTVIAGS